MVEILQPHHSSFLVSKDVTKSDVIIRNGELFCRDAVIRACATVSRTSVCRL